MISLHFKVVKKSKLNVINWTIFTDVGLCENVIYYWLGLQCKQTSSKVNVMPKYAKCSETVDSKLNPGSFNGVFVMNTMVLRLWQCLRHSWQSTHNNILQRWMCIYYVGPEETKVCQMLSWRTKNGTHSINIGDTVTNVLPLCSVYQAPSYEPSHTLIAWFLRDLAYLSMIFILEVLCIAGSAEDLKNK